MVWYNCELLIEPQQIATCTPGGGGSTPYNDLYEEALPERDTFFTLQVHINRVGISQVEVFKRVGKSIIKVFKRAFDYNISNRCPLWLNHFIY